MNKFELLALLQQLGALGGISRSLSEAKAAMHNSDVVARDAGETSAPGVGTEVIQERREAIRRKAEAIQDQIIEGFDTLRKGQGDLTVNQFITNSQIDQEQPWSTGQLVEQGDLRVGDVVDIRPKDTSGFLGHGVRKAELARCALGSLAFQHEGDELVILDSDEVYLVHRPKRELPTRVGSWIEVTGYEGAMEVPFKARCMPFGFWRKEGANGVFSHAFSPELVTDFHELELTRKEDA